MEYVTIDFEASCLPKHGRSFPVEVGISGHEGSRSWLIKPHSDWTNWDWTDEARGLHGLTPEQLHQQGTAPDIVMTELVAAIRGRRVIADSALDSIWWENLSSVVARPVPSPVEHVATFFDELSATSREIWAAQSYADQRYQKRHRAADDARWLNILLNKLQLLVRDRVRQQRLAAVFSKKELIASRNRQWWGGFAV